MRTKFASLTEQAVARPIVAKKVQLPRRFSNGQNCRNICVSDGPRAPSKFQTRCSPWDHVVVSGEVDLKDSSIEAQTLGGEFDNSTSTYEVHLIVGPWWKDVRVCVPCVTINGFNNTDADEDDQQLWVIRDLKWTTDGEGAPIPGEVRIRLEFMVELRGKSSWLRRFGYHFTAAGRKLGGGGISQPGPIKTGP